MNNGTCIWLESNHCIECLAVYGEKGETQTRTQVAPLFALLSYHPTRIQHYNPRVLWSSQNEQDESGDSFAVCFARGQGRL